MTPNQVRRVIDIERMEEIAASGDRKWQVYLAAQEYIAAGIYLLPLMPDQKSLPYQKEYNINYGSASKKPEIIEKWFHPMTGTFAGWNIGIATGRKGGVFAVDVDLNGEENGIENLAKLEKEYEKFPAGPVQSTPRGGKHYLFQWQDNAASSTSKIAKSIDTRGGTDKASKGHIVVFPSTVNGKQYKWEKGGDVPHLPPWVMEKMGAVWKAPKMGNGRGNENITEDDLEKQVPLDQVKRMLKSIDVDSLSYDEWLRIGMSIKSQHTGDEGLAIWDSWSKKGSRYKPNECKTRWYGFSDAGEVRIGTLFFYADESGYEPQKDDIRTNRYDIIVERLNKTYAIVTVGGKIRVLREKTSLANPVDGPFDLLGKEDFRTLLQNNTMQVPDAKGNPKLVSVADIWLAHQSRRTYFNGMALFPNESAPEGWYNTWKGFSVKPRPGACELLLNHIRTIICGGNDEHYEWVLDWCADAVQDPANPKGTAVVMRGEEGAGKGTLANTLGQLFGSHYRHLIDDSHLLNNFNAHMMDALFVFADEITWGGNVKSSGKLKGLVTERHLIGERKGVDAIGYRNMIHVMIASNSNWVVPAGNHSRRWFMLDVSSDAIGNKNYFDAIDHELNNGGTEAFLHFLLEREVTNNLRIAPETDALSEQRMRSSSSDTVLQWWIHCISKGIVEVPDEKKQTDTQTGYKWPGHVDKVKFYDNYVEWCLARNMNSISLYIFYTEIKNLGIDLKRINVNSGRKNVYCIPTVKDAIAMLKKKFNITIEE